MSTPKPERIYIVKSGYQYWTGKKWVECQVCALRMTWRAAHRFAHKRGSGLVFRLRKRTRHAT